jgi:hypothetical protein
MKEDIKLKLFNFKSNIKVNILCDFLSSNFFKKETNYLELHKPFF